MSYKTYEEARDDWLPQGANVIGEYKDDHRCILIYAADGHLTVLRFFPLSVGWEVSTDFCDAVEYIDGLESPV